MRCCTHIEARKVEISGAKNFHRQDAKIAEEEKRKGEDWIDPSLPLFFLLRVLGGLAIKSSGLRSSRRLAGS